MGIFAEGAHCIYEAVNMDENSLTAYFSSISSWHIVITRHNHYVNSFNYRTQTSSNTWTISHPKERWWSPDKKDFPIHAIYLVPWSTYDDGDGTHGLIKMTNNCQDKYMTRIKNIMNNYTRIHRFLSEFQYPFLEEIRKIQDTSLFFHQRKFKKHKIDRSIIELALSPHKMEYYLSLGYTIDDLCD